MEDFALLKFLPNFCGDTDLLLLLALLFLGFLAQTGIYTISSPDSQAFRLGLKYTISFLWDFTASFIALAQFKK